MRWSVCCFGRCCLFLRTFWIFRRTFSWWEDVGFTIFAGFRIVCSFFLWIALFYLLARVICWHIIIIECLLLQYWISPRRLCTDSAICVICGKFWKFPDFVYFWDQFYYIVQLAPTTKFSLFIRLPMWICSTLFHSDAYTCVFLAAHPSLYLSLFLVISWFWQTETLISPLHLPKLELQGGLKNRLRTRRKCGMCTLSLVYDKCTKILQYEGSEFCTNLSSEKKDN